MTKLYYHKTDGGAEYLSDAYVECPSGNNEGAFQGAKILVRIDGDIKKDAELLKGGPDAQELIEALRDIVACASMKGPVGTTAYLIADERMKAARTALANCGHSPEEEAPGLSEGLQKSITEVKNRTDGWPWYWLSYGEKCYAFAVVEAYPVVDGDEVPRPGTRLEAHPEDERTWLGENGTEMCVDSFMAEHEAQNGDAICRFIAEAHAALCGQQPREKETS